METKIVLSFFDSDGNDEMVQAVSGGHDQVVELPPCEGITSLPSVLHTTAYSLETTPHLMPSSTSDPMHPAISHHNSKPNIPSSSSVQYPSQTHQDMAGKQHLPVAEHLGAQAPSNNSTMETSHATPTGNFPNSSSLNASVSEYIPQSTYNHNSNYNANSVPMFNHHPNFIGVPVFIPPSNYSYSDEFTDQGFSEPNTSVPPPHSGYEHAGPYTMAFSNGQYFDQSPMHITPGVPHQMYPGHHVFTANYPMPYPECYSVDGGGVVRGEEVLGDQPLGGTGSRSSLNASSASAAVGPSTTAPAAASPSASATEYGITTTTAVTTPPQANHHTNNITMYSHHPSMHQTHSKPSLLHPPPMLPPSYHTAMVKHRASMNSALMQPSQSMVLVENSNVSLIVCPSNQGQTLPPFNTGAAGQPQRGAHYASSMPYLNPVMPHNASHHLAYQNASLAEHHRNTNRYKEQDSRTYRGARGNRGGGCNARKIKRNDGEKNSFSERISFSNNDKSYHSSGDRNLLSNERVPYGAEGPQSFSGDHCDLRNTKDIHTASNFACVPDVQYQVYSNVEKFKGQPIIMSDMLNHDHQNNGVHYSHAPPYYCPSDGMVPITLMMPQQHIVTTQASQFNHSKHQETYSEATCDNYNNRMVNTNMEFVNKDAVAEKNVNCINTTNYITNGNLPNESGTVTQQYEEIPLEEPTIGKTCASLESLAVSSHTEHVPNPGDMHAFESNNAQVQEFSYPSSRSDSPVTDSSVQGYVAPLHFHSSESGSHTTGAACPPDGCQGMNYRHSNVISSLSDVSDRIDHQQQHQDEQQQHEHYLQLQHHDQQHSCQQLEHQEQFHLPQHDQPQLEQQPLQLPIKMQKVCNGFAHIDKVPPILEITTEQELNLSFSMEFGDICPHDVYTEVNKLKASKLDKPETEVVKNDHDRKVEMTPNKSRKPPLFDTKIVDSNVNASNNTNVSKSLQFQFYSNDVSSHSSSEAPIQIFPSHTDSLQSSAASSTNTQCIVSSATITRHEVGVPTGNTGIIVSGARCPEVLSSHVSGKSPSLPMQAPTASAPAVPTSPHERAPSSSQTSSASTVQVDPFTNGVSSRDSSLAPSFIHAATNDKPPLPGLSSAKKLQEQSTAAPGAVSAWGKPKDWQNEFKNKKIAIVSPMLELHSTSTSDNVCCHADGSFSDPVSHNDVVSSAVSGKLAGDVLDAARYDIERTKIGGFLLDYKPDYSSVTLQPRGLTNKNYWCYSNTVLQAIVCVPQFVNLYRKMYELLGDIITPQTLPVTHSIISFLNEFSQMNSTINLNTRARGKKGGSNIVILPEISLGDPFEPSSIHKMLLEKTSGQFMEGYQQDAEEMLSFLLNASHDEFNECLKLASSKEAVKAGKTLVTAPVLPNGQTDYSNGPWVTMGPKNKSCITRTTEFSHSPISKIFWGESRSVIRKGNSPVTANLEPFITLPLDIQDDSITSVKEALEQFVSKADVAGYTCTDTQEELTVSNQRLLEQLPEVLILQLKRFVYSLDGGLQKVVKDIALSIDLEISKDLIYVHGRKKLNPEKSKYKLISIVYHDGKDANKGHYVCDVYHAGYNCWLHYDDACVKPITAAELHRCNAPRVPYLLFYRREDTFTDGNFPTAALSSNATKRKNKDKRNASKDKDSMERHSSLEGKTVNGSVALSQTIIDDGEKKAVVVNGSESNVDENVERKPSLDRKTSLERKNTKEIKLSQNNSQTQNKSFNKRQDKKSRANKKVSSKNN